SNFDCVKNKQKSKVRLFCRATPVGGLAIGVHNGTIDIDRWRIICCNNSENRQVSVGSLCTPNRCGTGKCFRM
ncbi:hypothetical protein TSMEX_003790, partial [Taenia solium]